MRPIRWKVRLALAASVAVFANALLPAVAQDAIGVASCDNFLKTYQTCIGAKIPAEQRDKVMSALDQTKANWKAVAVTADGKAKLDATCKDTAEKMKKEVAALNCAW